MLALQPAVDLATGAPTGVEALVRWRHPRRGLLGPADFIRPVEHSELLGAFTRYVLDKALAVAADWARRGLDVPVSVNLSARSLLDPRLPAEVAEALRRHQVPPRRLVLEITETVVMSELEVVDEVLAALRAMGVQLAVDDFGTGFSSLTFLTRVAGRRAEGRPLVRDPDGRLAGGGGDRPDHRRARPASWACGWWPRAWRPPSSGPRWPSWAAPPPRATTSSSRCRRTRSSRCSGRCSTPPRGTIFPLRADGAS